MHKPVWKGNRTASNIQHHTWLLRATAITSSWSTLLGYTFFAITLSSPLDNLRWSEDILASLGGIALGTGYAGGLIAYYFAHSLSFRLDTVILPLLLSSIGGIFELVLNYALHTETPISGPYIYVPLTIACTSTLICAGASLYLNTRLKIQQAIHLASHHGPPTHDPLQQYSLQFPDDASTPHPFTSTDPTSKSTSALSLFRTRSSTAGHPLLENPFSSQPPSSHSTSRPPLTASSTISTTTPQTTYPQTYGPNTHPLTHVPIPPPLRHMTSTELRHTASSIPEDEAQRRQLLRLLLARESDARNGASNPSPEPGHGTGETYRIDWPAAESDDESHERHSHAQAGLVADGKSPAMVGVSALTTESGGTTGRERWSIGALLGGRRRSVFDEVGLTGAGEGVSPITPLTPAATSGVAKEERERRRREIEAGFLPAREMMG